MLRDDVLKCMSDASVSDGGAMSARFVFPADFTGFLGHFPDKPVLPGVCIIQSVLVLIEAILHKTPSLREIVAAKFFTAVGPGHDLKVECSAAKTDGDSTIFKAHISGHEGKVALLTLRATI